MKRLIQFLFRIFGLEIRRRQSKKEAFHCNDQMKKGLDRFSKLNLSVNTVVDVGAAQGFWSLSAKGFWPCASYILFEPLEERKEKLKVVTNTNERFYYVPRAAGKESGTIYFSVSDDLDGSGVTDDPTNPQVRTVEVSSIQEEVGKHWLKGPYIIKLDTHGFEVPIIEGCSEIMAEVSLFIIECYGFQIADSSLLFWQMCQYMDARGFRLFDVVDIMHREKDGAFWQCDAFFIKKDVDLFKDNRYL